mgnify:CR=1 FL=1
MLKHLLVAALMLGAPATAQTLDTQIAQAEAAAARYTEFRTARRDGWRPFGGEAPLMGRHYQLRNGPDYVTGDAIDFSRPSNLVYATINGRRTLVALAYIVRKRPDEPLPQGFATREDIWHIHDGERFLSAIQETKPLAGALAGRWFNDQIVQKDGRTQLSMVHYWLIPNPKGRFASHNPTLAYRDLNLPVSWATDMEAARGIALAQANGCDEALDAELWVSGASRATIRNIKSTCRGIARQVREQLGGSRDEVQAFARAAWRGLEDARYFALTPDERRRMTAFVEDGPGVCR